MNALLLLMLVLMLAMAALEGAILGLLWHDRQDRLTPPEDASGWPDNGWLSHVEDYPECQDMAKAKYEDDGDE